MDLFDQASELERLERESALLNARKGTYQEGPEWIDGIPCCRECGEAIPPARPGSFRTWLGRIPPARLRAIPGVGLCRTCQEEQELNAGN